MCDDSKMICEKLFKNLLECAISFGHRRDAIILSLRVKIKFELKFFVLNIVLEDNIN